MCRCVTARRIHSGKGDVVSNPEFPLPQRELMVGNDSTVIAAVSLNQ
jgi:hypothetical protein